MSTMVSGFYVGAGALCSHAYAASILPGDPSPSPPLILYGSSSVPIEASVLHGARVAVRGHPQGSCPHPPSCLDRVPLVTHCCLSQASGSLSFQEFSRSTLPTGVLGLEIHAAQSSCHS